MASTNHGINDAFSPGQWYSDRVYGRWPATVFSYDQDSRTCLVEIPGLTDGAETLPIAEIEYPIGDKSRHTEIEIFKGDEVWVEFIRGDPRCPLITGWRNPTIGNSRNWRKWHHKNIELCADKLTIVKSGEDIRLESTGGSIILKASGGSIILKSTTGSLVV